MKIPKVFISYSHDSQEHKHWALNFATRLRNNGIDAIIDQWELKPGDDLPHFMETHLSNSDYILMVCTDTYVNKANSGTGGVGYEKMIITSDLLKNIDGNKVIPIIRQNGTHNVPTFLKTKLFIDFSIDSNSEFSYDELSRAIHKSPLFVKPEIGNNPFKPIEDINIEKTNDSLRELMKIVIDKFEKGEDWIDYKDIVKAIPISRILIDMIIKEAVGKALIKIESSMGAKYLVLRDEGKSYAIKHKLISI
jgi:hypothetical protein